MGRILEFKWMRSDTVMSHVWADKTEDGIKVDCIDYTDFPLYNFFGKRPKTVESITSKFSQRCFEESRPDKDELLEMMGLKEYSPLDICLVSNGVLCGDNFWIDWIIKPTQTR